MPTYEERTRAIPVVTLPPTFRDAVTIARTHGIRYLWIDSLCIIQDSKEDWYMQSARMGEIYALSFLIINASGSPDSQGGCFTKGPISDSMACVLRSVDSSVDIHFTTYIDEMPFSQMQTEDLTGKRAWCLQETVLPNRVVMYGSQMLGWLCDSKRISQQHGELGSAVGIRMEKHLGVEFTLQRWAFIVLNYTKRQITYEGDKLVALSGLAGGFHHILKDEYLAGIWRNDLIDGLLWDIFPGSGAIRPTQYRAPSWSWASLEGQISMKTNASAKEDVLTEIVEHPC